MEIEPQDAAASREHMGHTFYFCSPNCVAQFDADPHRYAQTALVATEAPLPVGSATTGVNPALPLVRIDLPVLGLQREQDGRAAEAAIRGLPGVRSAHANTGSGMITVEYDPQRTTTAALAVGLRPAGFRAGGATGFGSRSRPDASFGPTRSSSRRGGGGIRKGSDWPPPA